MTCDVLQQKLLMRKKQGNFRQLKSVENLIDFSSNDYLGLARSPSLNSKIYQEITLNKDKRHHFGSTGSRLLTGNSTFAETLEETIARFHGYEAGLLFNCGYMANLGLLSAVLNDQDVVYFDTSIHASTHDGIRLSKAKAFPFRHNDLFHLEKRLKHSPAARKRTICIESIYSMDGSKAPLAEICQLAEQYQAEVIVDEAHATGVCGLLGRGLVPDQHSFPKILAKVVTFGKALGVHGAIVLGSQLLRESLINLANPFMYTTAIPRQSLVAIQCAYQLFPQFEKEREHLNDLIQTFQEHFPNASETHIQAIPCQGIHAANLMAQTLAFHGFDVRPILSPTVQRRHEILRISLHAFNSKEEIVALQSILDSRVKALYD